MMGTMSRPSRTGERVSQKLRTRRALLDAARDLVAAGSTPTVPEAADAAAVSRATAYRYFPTQDALLVEVALELDAPSVDSLFAGDDVPAEPEDRVALVQNALYDHMREHDVQFRLFLRNALLRSVDAKRSREPLRRAGRVELLRAALEPLEGELDTARLDQLKSTLALLVGTEASIVLRDVLRLDHEQARAHGETAVRQAVRAARRDAADQAQVGRLLVISGLPGVGKTTVAERVATRAGSVHLSIDAVEESLLACGLPAGWQVGVAAYEATRAMAEQNLRLGHDVVVDAVNDSEEARQTWRSAASHTGAHLAFVQLVVSDVREHERRLRGRNRGLAFVGEPTWAEVEQRHAEYAVWTDEVVEFDTVGRTTSEVADLVTALLSSR